MSRIVCRRRRVVGFGKYYYEYQRKQYRKARYRKREQRMDDALTRALCRMYDRIGKP